MTAMYDSLTGLRLDNTPPTSKVPETISQVCLRMMDVLRIMLVIESM